MAKRIVDNRILWPESGDGRPRKKTFQQELKSDFTGFSSVVGFTSDGTKDLSAMFGSGVPVSFPKPVSLMKALVQQGSQDNGAVMDYFAGSGTTGHAVIELNREEERSNRKYILVEMGQHFDTVLKPRIQKIIYSKDWKDGKPVSRDGSSHMFKYMRLESYEDALNNLQLQRTPVQQELLDRPDARPMREDYLLHYMLDVESRGSLLPIDRFAEPFNYLLKIATGSVGESRPMTIDLVETFNYLLGLRVQRLTGTRDVRVVEGVDPSGAKVLVIWRSVSTVPNKELAKFFEQPDLRTRASASDIIYVNGDHFLESLRRNDETWQVRLIEEEFKQRMFDVRDV